MKAREALSSALVGLVAVGCATVVPAEPLLEAETIQLEQPAPEPAIIEPPEPEPEPPAFDTTAYSLDEASSLWVVVNKARPFQPVDYQPSDLVAPDVPYRYSPLLRQDAAAALEQMYQAAVAEGVEFVIQSSYRSYRLQKEVKDRSVQRFGQSVSDARSARAGHSEHQSGLAVDLTTASGACTLEECFGESEAGVWLAENSWRHGFILRYLPGKTDITGYVHEPWHFRYVGPELAAEVYARGYPTLEEFFGLPPAPTYLD